VVVTLLAVLELVRLQRARAQQRELFGDIVIERTASSGLPVELETVTGASPAPDPGGPGGAREP
jgi:chromatin segregation and condensation protein Rec8/ScpA/Scc1 (kleisin family)